MPSIDSQRLYRQHELPFRTQYAELKERCAAAGSLLPGTPGRLVLRTGTGLGYWYRNYYTVPGQEAEDFVCKDGNKVALDAARADIAFADWVARQVRDLRKLRFQVADKATARVLVELHNQGLFAAGLVVVGTLGFMALLNELGAAATAARTQDIDLARRQALKLATPRSFLQIVAATRLKFVAVPAVSPNAPATSVKRPGMEGPRIAVLADGTQMGRTLAIPELAWHAQTVPHYDYLLRDPRDACLLAGGHCIPVKLPAPERFVWHKLYSSTARTAFAEKALKDLIQAAVLAAVLAEQDHEVVSEALGDAPAALRTAARRRLPALRSVLGARPQALEEIESALAA